MHEGGNKFNPLVGDFTLIAENLPFPNESSIGDYRNYNEKYEGSQIMAVQVITLTDRSGYERNELGIDSSCRAFPQLSDGFGTSPSSGALLWTDELNTSGSTNRASATCAWPFLSADGSIHLARNLTTAPRGLQLQTAPLWRLDRTVTRFHSGGSLASVGGGGASRPVIHVNNFTDPKAMLKAVSTQQGQKIIVDTVRGRSIDLGL